MTTDTIEEKVDFLQTLAAAGRNPEIPEDLDIYGWLVGSWELDVRFYRTDVSAQKLKGEAHFGRVLEGRAVQDTWIMPQRTDRTAVIDRTCNMYGMTFRMWDSAIQAWRVTWINPVTGMRDELIGRRQDDEIIQVGTHSNGVPIRWIFTEITANSFHWIGDALDTDGKSWKREGEFLATRIR